MTYFVVIDHLTKGAAWSGNDKCQISYLHKKIVFDPVGVLGEKGKSLCCNTNRKSWYSINKMSVKYTYIFCFAPLFVANRYTYFKQA